MTSFTKPEVPAGYVEVTPDTFWNALKTDKRDIMPLIVDGQPGSYWATNNHNRAPFGWTDSYLQNGFQHVHALLIDKQ